MINFNWKQALADSFLPILYPVTGRRNHKNKQIVGYTLINARMVGAITGHCWNFCNGYILNFNRKNTPKTMYLHRLIMKETDRNNPEMETDHKDLDPKNNVISNLRMTTRPENCANYLGRARRKYSIYAGVTKNILTWTMKDGTHKRNDRWVAQTPWHKRRSSNHDTEVDAARAYDKRKLEQYGEFALLNFPEEV